MRYIWMSLLLFFLGSCGIFSKPTNKVSTPNMDLVSIQSRGSSGRMGDSTQSLFTYNFEIGKTEVTRVEFQKEMGYLPLYNHPIDSMPVTMVSWYEAIIYCNALSKRFNYDSVYRYSNIQFGADGFTIQSFEGLITDYSKDGFRLPTEAEWEFSARGTIGSNYLWGDTPDTTLAEKFSWFQNNSNESAHMVCTKEEWNGLCDLSGNVMEWVDGWLSDIPMGSVTDFVGALQPNSSQARIIKGGSFRSSIGELKLTKRTDVYGTYSNTRTPYIGFRVARGKIIQPHFSLNGGSVENKGSPLRVVTSREQLKSFLGTTSAKLALVNGTNDYLATVDFSQPSLFLLEAPEMTVVRHPTISPNGKYIAYSTRSEGQTGESSIYLRQFIGGATETKYVQKGWIPRWHVDSTGDTLLLYSSEASSNRDSILWSKETTSAIRLQSLDVIGNPITITNDGSFHDGLSSDNRYLITGFTDLRLKDFQTGQIHSLFRFPENGKTAETSYQACNASISQGENPRIAFLDFGYTGTSTLTGSSYESHEYIFLMDPESHKVVDTIRVPDPWKSWDHLEWSNHPNFLVATVTDESDNQKAVYLIRVTDHATHKLLEGENVSTPYLWIASNTVTNPSPDSLLMYTLPDNGASIIYSPQIIRFWETRNSAVVYAIGSSRTMHGINPSLFTFGNTINLGITAADPWTLIDLWKSYIRFHATALKAIVLEISPDFFYYLPEEHFIPYFGVNIGRAYDSTHGFWQAGLPSDWDQLLATAPQSSYAIYYQADGYIPRPDENFGTEPLDVKNITNYLIHPNSWIPALDSLEATIREITSKGILVVGVVFPQNPKYSNLDLFGRYGPSLGEAHTIMDELKKRTADIEGFTLFDQHQFGQHDYKSSEAFDYDHLGITGAIKICRRIDSVLIVNRR